MTKHELHSRILSVLAENSATANEIEITPDTFEGWRVRVVATCFKEMGDTQRRELIAPALDGEHIVWREFLSPDEAEQVEAVPYATESLPLWPESLARGAKKIDNEAPVLFLTDSEEELSAPVTVTFYSLRGGVGRSTSLAHTARLLAKAGKQVVCMDLDIEAPGLAALFDVEAQVENNMGVVELLMLLDQGGSPDFSRHLVPVDDEGQLFLIPAGLPDAAYAHDLSLLDPGAWYTEESNPLRLLMEGVRSKLPFIPDVILIDSRTGISAISAPLLFEQADLAVVAMFPHEQARRGTEALVKGLMAACNYRFAQPGCQSIAPEIRFLVGPLPNTPQLRDMLHHRALEWVAEWLSPIQQARQDNGLLELNEDELTHWVPYQEVLAASRSVLDFQDIQPLYGRVEEWIEGLLPVEAPGVASDLDTQQKIHILHDLKVEAGTAEDQQNLLDVFVETDVIVRAINPKNPLVLGRKGTGKTALFRRIEEQHGDKKRVMPIMSPLANKDNSIRLNDELFRELDRQLISSQNLQWKQFWMAYLLLLACERNYVKKSFLDAQLWENPLPGNAIQLVEWMSKLSEQPMYGLKLNEAFKGLDSALERPLLLLWDGLDTQFGNEQTDRKRRSSALAGLLSMMLDWERVLTHINFKVLLREDIWRELKFENKSHLYGRSVVLQWNDQNSFLKVLVKQLWRSDPLRQWIQTALEAKERLSLPIEKWSDDDLRAVWHLIAGTRMSGGRTAFTRNWVWTRLADANGDHAPRHLLQLLREAVDIEKNQELKASYSRSLIRPNTLIKALPEVSAKALDALIKEEFQELEALTVRLREIARTPFDAGELDSIDKSQLLLAKEVGLLGIHEGTEQRAERYRVPELYRLALKMTRKGQS